MSADEAAQRRALRAERDALAEQVKAMTLRRAEIMTELNVETSRCDALRRERDALHARINDAPALTRVIDRALGNKAALLGAAFKAADDVAAYLIGAPDDGATT